MVDHSLYHYSVTIRSTDLAIVNCLRSLAQFSQKQGNNRIPWGGTKDRDWKSRENCVTFRFTTPDYRAGFVAEVARLLPLELIEIVSQSDDDPALPIAPI